MANSNFLPGISVAGLVLALAAPWPASAAENGQAMDGAAQYRQYCASCHGMTGEGDGRVAKKLEPPPPALTTLSQRHGGVFPAEYVSRIIDGREERKAHGARVMPVWGTYYGILAQGQGRDAPDTETAIGQRISALIEHLRSIQTGD